MPHRVLVSPDTVTECPRELAATAGTTVRRRVEDVLGDYQQDKY
jgi:hypothetical protein